MLLDRIGAPGGHHACRDKTEQADIADKSIHQSTPFLCIIKYIYKKVKFMRLALVHEPLIRFGGAERVLLALHKLFPAAPIFTPYADHGVTDRFFTGADIRESFLAHTPLASRPRLAMPFLPLAFESFDLRDFDMVVSSSSAFSKGVVTRSHAQHISYVHTPPRFLWEDRHYYLASLRVPRVFKAGAVPLLHWLRTWDQHAAHRVDRYIANSQYTARRLMRYYQKDAQVLYPPVDTMCHEYDDVITRRIFSGGQPFFFAVARFTPHKKLDLAVETFSKFFLKTPLVVAGIGPEAGKLKKNAGKNIRFLGWQDEGTVRALMHAAEAFLMPNVEDFGIAAVEAMAEGTPVLAYRGGGALETVVEGETGEFFDDVHPVSLADGIRRIRQGISGGKYDIVRMQAHIKQFSENKFSDAMRAVLAI